MRNPIRNALTSYLFALAVGGALSRAQAQEFQDPSHDVIVSQAQCSAMKESIWVTVSERGDCIRYYTAGLSSSNPRAIFYIHGDAMWSKDQSVVSSYKGATSASAQAKVDGAFTDTGIPVVMIGRPGLYGSSGEHSKRRQPRELALVEAALNQIRSKHNIGDIAITGQSGGGSVAAYLAAKLPEAKCVVFTSSALSVETLKAVGQTDGYIYGDGPIYDPAKHLDEMALAPRRRTFVIGDPKDEYARIENQRDYFDRAKKAGLDIIRMEAEGEGHHSLDRTGWTVAGWCMKGMSAEEIERRVSAHEVTF